MKTMDADSIDSIVTDPPYELGFMGKSWDSSGIAFNVEVWQEALRVLKPGGHLIAFSGSRTYHRMAVAIEDAGFEIRDQIMWVYGSGFPKSHDVSKAIDKNNGETDRLVRFTLWMRTTGLKVKDVTKVLIDNNLIGENGTIAGHYFASKATSQPAIPTVAMWQVIRPLVADVPEWVDELVDRIEAEREVIGERRQRGSQGGVVAFNTADSPTELITAPATAAAKQWQGWGTALKPAHEPMVLARKPLIGTVANNVLTYGVGGLNIDATRVGNEVRWNPSSSNKETDNVPFNVGLETEGREATGRFPANFIHDGSDEVVALFPDTKTGSIKPYKHNNSSTIYGGGKGLQLGEITGNHTGDSGSAARFFYCAKASKKDRNEGLDRFETVVAGGMQGRQDGSMGSITMNKNHHPTVKPTSLMQYLVRLITPPNGIVLDPFLGSGSTGKAAMYEGFNFVGIELTPEYLPIAKARIEFALKDKEGELDFESR